MSYILEALKKSDQQRQRGATPTLQVAQMTAAVPKRPVFIYYSLLAAVLLILGIMIGWLRPWQLEQPSSETVSIAPKSPISISQQAAPVPLTAPTPTLSKTEAPGAATPIPDKAMPDKPAKLAGVTQEQKVMPLDELPLAIQQEIPAMTVQLHAYSNIPSERLVSINSVRLREGGSLMLGLKLEQITPDGMIFSYKGYRFQHGIR